jgi:hypothetical protein
MTKFRSELFFGGDQVMAKTKEVDKIVRSVWAKLASHVAQRAADSAKDGDYYKAESAMEWLEVWLNNAGARATSWYFRRPE